MSEPTEPPSHPGKDAVEVLDPEPPTPRKRRPSAFGKALRNSSGRFQKSMTTAERAKAACDLLVLGKNFQQIADELGYANRASAKKLIDKAIADFPASSAAAARRMLVGGMLEIWAAHLPLATGKKRGTVPCTQSAATCDMVAKRLAGLFGLDAPRQLRVEVDRELDEFFNRIEKGLPPDVYERVLAIAAGGEGGSSAGEAEEDPPSPADGTPEDA